MEELRVSKLLGGALAAVTGAVLASFTGVQGTLAGAAVTSIFMAVTTTLYTHSLSFAHRQMRRTMARRTSGDRDDDRDRDGGLRVLPDQIDFPLAGGRQILLHRRPGGHGLGDPRRGGGGDNDRARGQRDTGLEDDAGR
jgi:hypothetical protein